MAVILAHIETNTLYIKSLTFFFTIYLLLGYFIILPKTIENQNKDVLLRIDKMDVLFMQYIFNMFKCIIQGVRLNVREYYGLIRGVSYS